jgi:hypothetical protein
MKTPAGGLGRQLISIDKQISDSFENKTIIQGIYDYCLIKLHGHPAP